MKKPACIECGSTDLSLTYCTSCDGEGCDDCGHSGFYGDGIVDCNDCGQTMDEADCDLVEVSDDD